MRNLSRPFRVLICALLLAAPSAYSQPAVDCERASEDPNVSSLSIALAAAEGVAVGVATGVAMGAVVFVITATAPAWATGLVVTGLTASAIWSGYQLIENWEAISLEDRAYLAGLIAGGVIGGIAGGAATRASGVSRVPRTAVPLSPAQALGDLSAQEVAQIQAIANKLPPGERLIVYGSAARGARRNPGHLERTIGKGPEGRSDIDYSVDTLQNFVRVADENLPSLDVHGVQFANEGGMATTRIEFVSGGEPRWIVGGALQVR